MLEGSSSIVHFQNFSSSLYGFDEYDDHHYQKQFGLQEEEDGLLASDYSYDNNSNFRDYKLGKINNNQVILTHSPPLSSSSSSANSSSAFAFHQPQEEADHSLINFKTMGAYGGGGGGFMPTSGSLLSFQQAYNIQRVGHPNEYPIWEGSSIISSSTHQSSQLKLMKQNSSSDLRALNHDPSNCLQTSSDGYQDVPSEWLYAEGAAMTDGGQESTGAQQACFNKRPQQGEENMQAAKKQCVGGSRKPQPKPTSSKDPQSIAAKNRRERISEKLKTLQDLVPNGSKVDLVTMLEKAISYVKFLQLQVKVLATDEFWPVAGGKAPDISQVREAIDAILSSQRNTSSSSKFSS
ncbi:hypothetical protein Ancab_006422 [Ancistrocladus abbreviatus]